MSRFPRRAAAAALRFAAAIGFASPRASGRLLRAAAAAVAVSAAGGAAAHKPSDAYLTFEVAADHVDERFDIALRDLDRDLVLDANDDGSLTWGEVQGRWAEIERLADAGARLQAGGAPCRAQAWQPAMLDDHSDGRYAVLQRRWTCAPADGPFSIDYSLFAHTDPSHRGVAQLKRGGAIEPAVLAAGAPPHVFGGGGSITASGSGSFFGTLGDFIVEGIHHILIGSDHILFLLSLLLPVVLVPASRTPLARSVPVPRAGSLADRPPAESLKPVLIGVLKVVTAFTVAHSITLALATLGIVDPPSRWIESVIAASVVAAALNNVVPVVGEGRWKITFVFGLVHGFGFASVLKDIGLEKGGLVAPLVGFNLGVEIGQLAIVAIFLPIAWSLRRTAFYRRWLLTGGSLLIAALAAAWFVERAFDLRLLPFFH